AQPARATGHPELGVVPTGSGQTGSRFTIVGPNIQVNTSDTCSPTTGKTQSETAIAHSGGAIVIAYNDSRGFYCPPYQVTAWGHSRDRGGTFTQGGPPPGTGHGGDPWLAAAPDGGLYLTDLRVFNNNLAGINFMKGSVTSTGIGWSDPVVLGSAIAP